MSDDRHGDRQLRDEHIVSPANPTIKLARSLHRRRIRQRERAILVEGVRAVLTAIGQGARIQSLLVDAERQAQISASDMRQMRSATARVVFVDPDLYRAVADTEHPQAVIAICDMPAATLPADSSLLLAVDGVRDPGNLGTLIRAAAAAGVDGVALLPGTVDRFNPKAIRASAGSVFSIPVAPFPDMEQIAARCFEARPVVVLADGGGDTRYDEIDWTVPIMLVIGGEAEGASSIARTYADIVAKIPIDTSVESLNAGLAGGIMLFEARRQRDASR